MNERNMMARPKHPNIAVEGTLRDLEKNRGWKVAISSDKRIFTVTCKAGTMSVRIPALMGPGLNPRQDLLGFMQEHARAHPAE